MAGLGPATHFLSGEEDMDARNKAGQDGGEMNVNASGTQRIWRRYASPSVSNIAALIASAADLPAQTTNCSAG